MLLFTQCVDYVGPRVPNCTINKSKGNGKSHDTDSISSSPIDYGTTS